MQSTKQAIFMLEEIEYGLDIVEINIIEKYMPIEPVANLPSNLKGIIRLRGEIIPVYSLRRKLGLKEVEQSEDTRFIITVSQGLKIAYEIDKISEIVVFEEEQLFETPSIVRSKETSYIKQFACLDDRMVILLDNDGILTEEELEKINTVLQK